MGWLWAFSASSLAWALVALVRQWLKFVRHRLNLEFLEKVFEKGLNAPDGNFRDAAASMKDTAEAVRLIQGDDSTPSQPDSSMEDVRQAPHPEKPPGDPPMNGHVNEAHALVKRPPEANPADQFQPFRELPPGSWM